MDFSLVSEARTMRPPSRSSIPRACRMGAAPNPATIGEDAPDTPGRVTGGRQLRILIVEDEVDIANAVKGVLVADGHAVDIVGDGAARPRVGLDVCLRPRDPRRRPSRSRRLRRCAALREPGSPGGDPDARPPSMTSQDRISRARQRRRRLPRQAVQHGRAAGSSPGPRSTPARGSRTEGRGRRPRARSSDARRLAGRAPDPPDSP